MTSVAAVLPYGFAATERGLDRWDLRSGQRIALSADHGLPGDRVGALALDQGRGWLWVATDGGLTRYDVAGGIFTLVPPAPTDALTAVADKVNALAAGGAGGVWVGSDAGLAYADTDAGWRWAGMPKPVTALLRRADGTLWVGTRAGIVVRHLDGTFHELDDRAHCDVQSVRFFVETPDGAALAVGENAAGKQRVAIIRAGTCATFRVSPDATWRAATVRGDEIVVLTKRRLYALGVPKVGARQLTRDGMRLIPVAAGTDIQRNKSPYVARSLNVRVPTGASSISTAGDELLIGTRELGTARITRRNLDWLRRGELVGGTRVSVACAKRDDCLVVTGANNTWRFDGARFHAAVGAPGPVFSVVPTSGGGLVAAFRIGEEPRVRLARVTADSWEELEAIDISTPGTSASVAFTARSPRGALWIGLRYVDEVGDERPYGVAEVDLDLALVAYHRETVDDEALAAGVLPIPIDAVDAAFLDDEEVWIASSQGVGRVKGRKVRTFTEADGVVSELVRGVAVTSGGVVFAATRAGVAVYDGSAWSAPRVLRRPVTAVAVDRGGRLWMATARGVAVYDGARVRRLDARRGLLEDDVLDVEIDRFGRVWALSKQGISIVTP